MRPHEYCTYEVNSEINSLRETIFIAKCNEFTIRNIWGIGETKEEALKKAAKEAEKATLLQKNIPKALLYRMPCENLINGKTREEVAYDYAQFHLKYKLSEKLYSLFFLRSVKTEAVNTFEYTLNTIKYPVDDYRISVYISYDEKITISCNIPAEIEDLYKDLKFFQKEPVIKEEAITTLMVETYNKKNSDDQITEYPLKLEPVLNYRLNENKWNLVWIVKAWYYPDSEAGKDRLSKNYSLYVDSFIIDAMTGKELPYSDSQRLFDKHD